MGGAKGVVDVDIAQAGKTGAESFHGLGIEMCIRDRSAAYTAKGKLVIFSPSLNHFALIGGETSSAINDPEALKSSIAHVKATLASLPVPAATNGRPHAPHVPESLLGDNADSQMRRIYLAFQQAGIPVYLKSGDTPTLTFSWQGRCV